MPTKARQFKKFIGSSADDSIGVGCILEGHEIRKDRDGLLFLNTGKPGKKADWVEVYEIVEVAVATKLAIVQSDSLPESDF